MLFDTPEKETKEAPVPVALDNGRSAHSFRIIFKPVRIASVHVCYDSIHIKTINSQPSSNTPQYRSSLPRSSLPDGR